MKKAGRPKKDKKNSIFVGIHMDKTLADKLTKDASRHFRMRTQHIMWILSTYIKNQEPIEAKAETNHSLYTEEELQQMYKEYKEDK